MQPTGGQFAEYLDGARWAVISRLAPGGYLLPHRDKGPHLSRVQIPLEAGGWYWDERVGTIQMTAGVNVVRHHLAHCVWNDTDRDRIHLVVDRDPQHADGPFQRYPVEVCAELVTFLNL